MRKQNWSLATFCDRFNIPEENCSCTNDGIPAYLSDCITSTKLPIKRVIFEYSDASLAYGVIALLASIVGIFGNSLVLLVAWRNRKIYLVCQKLIAILAGNDVFFACVQLVLCIPRLWTYEWLYGSVGCKILISVHELGAIVAVGFIVIISIERFLGVVKPMYRSLNLIVILCCLNGVFGLVTVVPLVINHKVNHRNICELNWPSTKVSIIYSSYVLTATCIIPAVMVISLYFFVIYKFRQSTIDKDLQKAMDKKLYRKRLRDNKRIIKIALALITAFIVFVFPNRVIMLYFQVSKVSNHTYGVLSVISLVTYPFHVAINPVLYSVIDARWRKQIVKIFRGNNVKKRRLSTFGASPITTHEIPIQKSIRRCDTEESVVLYGGRNVDMYTQVTTKM